ncbi:MAG: flagellar basal body P-ring formation protein FlgA [Methylococcaceae bacterium]|nr:flagellar basal body P-ring formation protein FlgA [Methylococcaceae bacterium]
MKKQHLNIIVFALGFSLTAHAQQEQAFQSHESIYSAVRNYIAGHIDAVDYETNLMQLDNQLKLPACPMPLDIFIPNDLIKPGRNSIGVRCNTNNKWSIFTSASIKTYQNVLILTRPLQRGETLTRQHLSMERRDISGLRGDYVTQIEDVLNKQASRPLPSGSLLSSRNIAEPKVIKRGDNIVISSARPDFAIRMNGTAMMDGVKGQNIRIKNQSSGRIINATVVEPGLVSVDQ